MTNQEIKELVQIFHESGVGEMEVQRGENRLRLSRQGKEQQVVVPAATQATSAPPPPLPVMAHSTGAGTAAAPARMAEADGGLMLVKSPIVGTYYEQSAPGSPPFVKVGDSVEPGQVLCIIESMKLMNEIEAETAGIISAKLVENGRPVEYGEALFSIRPR
jgi:acetyl-CoA carboxylase biotin carboxyl carrier protein